MVITMMKVVKRRNTEAIIDETKLDKYLKDGWKVVSTNEEKVDETVKPLENMTVSELKEIAEELKIESYSSLNKAELLEVIKKHGA